MRIDVFLYSETVLTSPEVLMKTSQAIYCLYLHRCDSSTVRIHSFYLNHVYLRHYFCLQCEKKKKKFSYVLNQTQLKDCKALFRLVAKRNKLKKKKK